MSRSANNLATLATKTGGLFDAAGVFAWAV
jgi:hypothetical protein